MYMYVNIDALHGQNNKRATEKKYIYRDPILIE